MVIGTYRTTVFILGLFYKQFRWNYHFIKCNDIKSADHPKFVIHSYRQREYESDHSPLSHAKVWDRNKFFITYNSIQNGVQSKLKLFCQLFYDAICTYTIQHSMSKCLMTWNGFERKWPWHNSITIMVFDWKDWGEPQKNLSGKPMSPAVTTTKHLLNTCLECYQYINPLWVQDICSRVQDILLDLCEIVVCRGTREQVTPVPGNIKSQNLTQGLYYSSEKRRNIAKQRLTTANVIECLNLLEFNLNFFSRAVCNRTK
jgi:hypothetical protein